MLRKTAVAAVAAATLGCANCDPAAPQAGGGSHSAETSASAEGPVLTPPPPGVQVAAYAPASDSNDGRVFFDGDRLRDGLNGGGVRGQYADNSRKWASLRGQLATSRQGRAQYAAVPAPRGTSGNGLRPDASAPELPAGKVFSLNEYQRFEQAMYTTVYPVLTRMGWNARQRRGGASGMDPYRLTVHHTMGHQTSARRRRRRGARHPGLPPGPRARLGRHRLPLLIDGDGRAAEAARQRPGAHAAEANHGNLGISLMGNLTSSSPPTPRWILERLAAYLALRYDIPVMKSATSRQPPRRDVLPWHALERPPGRGAFAGHAGRGQDPRPRRGRRAHLRVLHPLVVTRPG